MYFSNFIHVGFLKESSKNVQRAVVFYKDNSKYVRFFRSLVACKRFLEKQKNAELCVFYCKWFYIHRDEARLWL